MPVEIKYVNKIYSPNPYERITRVGGIHDGVRWSKGVSQIIYLIESDQESFFIRRLNIHITVTIGKNNMGYKYIQAMRVSDDTNQLLWLPECLM